MTVATELQKFMPITKVVEETRMVYGVMAEEAADQSKEVMDWETGWPAIKAWSDGFLEKTTQAGQEESLGNVRVQHDPKWLGGKVTELQPDHESKKALVGVKVTDDKAWELAKTGVLTGFSLGGSYAKKWPSDVEGEAGLVRYTPTPGELSMVDNPCMKGATFLMVKANGAEEQVPFTKDAASLNAATDGAVEAIKKILVELGQLSGAPSTISIEDTAAALKAILWVKDEAAWMESQEGQAMEQATKDGELQKWVAEQHPALETLQKQVSFLQGPPDPEPEGEADLAKTLTDTLTSTFQKSLDEAKAELLEKLQAAETASEAVKTELQEVKESLEKAEARLKKVEETPAQAGKPVSPMEKALGTVTSTTGGITQEAMEKAIEQLEAQGILQGQDRARARLALAAAAMPRSTGE